MDDLCTDRVFHMTLWGVFFSPETKKSLGVNAAMYESKLPRCQRIIEKHKQIEAEIDSNQEAFFKRLGCPVPSDFVGGDEEEMKRNIIAKATVAFDARKDRKRIVLKARQPSETDDHEFGMLNNSKVGSGE